MKESVGVLIWCVFCYFVPYLIGQAIEPLAMMFAFFGGMIYMTGLEWYYRRVVRKGFEG